jgi:hypothetical protein
MGPEVRRKERLEQLLAAAPEVGKSKLKETLSVLVQRELDKSTFL